MKTETLLMILTEKSTYSVGEPIEVEVRRINNGTVDTFIVNRLYLNHNVRIEVSDEKGEPCLLRRLNEKMTVAPPRGMTDFVKLEPGSFLGVLDVTEGCLCFDTPGRYRLTARLWYDPGIELAQQLNLNYDSQPAISNEVQIVVASSAESGNNNLTDKMFWFLDVVSKYREPVGRLVDSENEGDNHFYGLFNREPHGMTTDEVVSAMVYLFESGLILAWFAYNGSDYSSEPGVLLSEHEIADCISRDTERIRNDEPRYWYGLTERGREEWKLFTQRQQNP